MENTADIKIIPYNESYVKIDSDKSIIMELSDFFAFFVEGYQFQNKYKYGSWDGKIRLMQSNGLLPYGLRNMVYKYAERENLTVYMHPLLNTEDKMGQPEFDSWLDSFTLYSGNTKIEPYWYQRESIFKAINQERCILNLPTSAGKSLIQCMLCKWFLDNYDDKVLLIVPKTSLVLQMIDDFADYRVFKDRDCLGIMSGTDKDGPARIYVSTWQSAVKQPKEWFSQFGMLLMDEVHLATGVSCSQIVQTMVDCKYKIGLSGSLKDGKANILQYVGLFGDIYKPVTTKQLMDEGSVSNLKINIMKLIYPQDISKAVCNMKYQDEIKWIINNKTRNLLILKMALKFAKQGENVMLAFRFVSHGKKLYEALKATYDNVVFVDGGVGAEKRNDIKKDAEIKSGMIIVASLGVFSTGISIKKLHHVMFASPIKAKITIIQTIGRALRKHDSKDTAKLWDFIDQACVVNSRKNAKKKFSHENYAYQHGTDRLERYITEDFEFNIKEVKIA